MKIIDRYLLKNFLTTLFSIIFACYAILLIFEIFENFSKMLENQTPIEKALAYFWYAVPYQVLQILPLAVMLAMLFAIGVLARNKEILAMLASGVSAYRIASPIIICGIILSLTMLFLNEVVVYKFQEKKALLERVYIDGKPPRDKSLNVFRKGEGQRYFLVQEFDYPNQTIKRGRIIELDPDSNKIKNMIAVTSAERVGHDAESDRDEWDFVNTTLRQFDGEGRIQNFQEVRNDEGGVKRRASLEPGIHQLLNLAKDPNLMNIRDGFTYIKNMKRIEEPTYNFETQVYLNLFFPFSCVMMVLIGFAFALRAQSGRTLLAGFGLGIFYAILFYAITAILRAITAEGVLPAWFAAILPLTAFTIFGFQQIKNCMFIK